MSRTLKDRPWRIRSEIGWCYWSEPAGPKIPRNLDKRDPARVHLYCNPYGPGWFRTMTVYRRERPEFRNWAATLRRDLSEVDPPPLRYREYWD